MKKITAVLLGAGDRGMFAYGPFAVKNPLKLQFVAVAEPDAIKREQFRAQHSIPAEYAYATWEDVLNRPKMADAVFICTQDRMHFDPTMKALELGYNVLLEKPMSNDPAECLAMAEASEKKGLLLAVCHVLRYTRFFLAIKRLLDSGKIGKLISIQHNEDVGYYHQAHSFVRGNWRNSRETNPMILAKSCHDMDLLSWYAGSDCTRVASFGGLTHFRAEEAPSGAPARCLDGCPAERHCPYYAPKWYLTDNVGWPTSVISADTSYQARYKALLEGPYGRCVYQCDNDVVDHQVVITEFENDVTAAFTMCAFNKGGRSIKLMGTKGMIRGIMEKNEIEVFDFETTNTETITVPRGVSSHGGGDFGIIEDFLDLLNHGKAESLTSGRASLQSHLMAFASEKARVEHRVVEIADFIKTLR